MNKKELLENTNDNEKILLSNILDKIEISKTKNKIVDTNFFNEYEQKLIQNLLKNKIQ